VRREGFLRNFIFGVEDSLVSTVGFVSGVATSAVDRPTLLLSGVILVSVEAFSMAVGSFLSDESVRQVRLHGRATAGPSLVGGLVMFLSYIVTGFFVLAPYWLLPNGGALAWSVGVSLVALFLLGVFAARIAGMAPLRRGIRMSVIGGAAIVLGILVGNFMS